MSRFICASRCRRSSRRSLAHVGHDRQYDFTLPHHLQAVPQTIRHRTVLLLVFRSTSLIPHNTRPSCTEQMDDELNGGVLPDSRHHEGFPSYTEDSLRSDEATATSTTSLLQPQLPLPSPKCAHFDAVEQRKIQYTPRDCQVILNVLRDGRCQSKTFSSQACESQHRNVGPGLQRQREQADGSFRSFFALHGHGAVPQLQTHRSIPFVAKFSIDVVLSVPSSSKDALMFAVVCIAEHFQVGRISWLAAAVSSEKETDPQQQFSSTVSD